MESAEEIKALLNAIPDPEVPVISIVELGIVRDVRVRDKSVEIDITPTYSGCPAMKMIEDQIVQSLTLSGYENVRVNMVYAPAWTTEWIGPAAREKLKHYGIAPPLDLVSIKRKQVVRCPRCNSEQTKLQSEFGATACKALYTCGECLEPFEYFKAF